MSIDVREVMRSVYGEELGAVEGVLHVVAVHEQDGERRVIRIGEHSPRSATDRFALDLARTRVEAILVTGAILREEPELRYELPLELERYRREALGLKDPPWLLVLTRGDVSLDHPALGGWARPIVLTSKRAAEALPTRAEVEIVGVPEPSARAALAYLRDERGCRAISIEAGPKTAVPLYDAPCAIDELALSVYSGALDPRARGGHFLGEDETARELVRTSAHADGEWRFERWIRRARAGSG